MTGRIRQRHEFETLARHGRRARTATLWCRYVDDIEATPPRVGFALGRALGSAVARNRLRRRLRAIFDAALAANQLGHGLLLIGAQPAAGELVYADLRGEVTALLAELARHDPEAGPS